jgi:RNA polymerase sigma-70 factor (ECF subfamily)
MSALEFNASFNKLYDLLFAFAMKLTRNKEDAKDLMQETAMLAYANLHRFEPGTHFKSWVSTIMRNSFINNYRKMKTRNKVEKPIEDFLYTVENKTVHNQANSMIMQKELTGILDSLSDDYKVPFLMFFQGYHYDEIAEHMNLPIGTVKSRIFYARKQLKDMINLRYEAPGMRA